MKTLESAWFESKRPASGANLMLFGRGQPAAAVKLEPRQQPVSASAALLTA